MSPSDEMTAQRVSRTAKEQPDWLIKDENGNFTDNLIYTLRNDNEVDYLFIAHAKHDNNPDISRKQSLTITIKGKYKVELMDTSSGEICSVSHHADSDSTTVMYDLYNNDSLNPYFGFMLDT